jgi:hypothetical protein
VCTCSPRNRSGTGTCVLPVPETGPGLKFFCPVDETGTGPASVPGLGLGRDSRRALVSCNISCAILSELNYEGIGPDFRNPKSKLIICVSLFITISSHKIVYSLKRTPSFCTLSSISYPDSSMAGVTNYYKPDTDYINQ